MHPPLPERANGLKKYGWLLVIWLFSVLALGVFATLFRGFMGLAGLTV